MKSELDEGTGARSVMDTALPGAVIDAALPGWDWDELSPADPSGPSGDDSSRGDDAIPGTGAAGSHDLGRYVLLEKLGAGGMGAVYAAFDPQLERRVAIKILAGISKAANERLLREGQAMARLAHPNVVAIHDIGEVRGRLFVAMELVGGSTLRRWLDERPRAWREILASFLQAGRGLAAAHAAGLVHRDFKPDNVLVGRDGRICVTDFGLARPASGNARDTQIMGTARYMAPEQFGSGEADARTDQFSFCVALYEALYGQSPFPGKSLPARMLNAARGQVAAPPRSVRIPGRAHRILCRGLSGIPENRYPDMGVLLEDLSRLAVRVDRRRVLVAAGVAAALGALAVHHEMKGQVDVCSTAERPFAGIWDGPRKQVIREAFSATGKGLAGSTVDAVARTLDGYASSWTAMSAESCEKAWVRHEETQVDHSLRVVCLKQRLDEVRALTELFARADGEVVENASRAASALTPLAGCADLPTLERQARADTGGPGQGVDQVRGKLAEVKALLDAGKYHDGLDIAQAALISARGMGHRSLEAESLLLIGQLEWNSGDMKDAATTLQEAGWAADSARNDTLRARAALELIYVLGFRLSRFDEAQSWVRQVQALIERMGGDTGLQAELEFKEGLVLTQQGKPAEAVAHAEKAVALREASLGPDSPETAREINGLALALLHVSGQTERALALYQRALDIWTRTDGPASTGAALALNNLGAVYYQLRRYPESLAYHQRALAIQEQLGPDQPNAADCLHNIGETLREMGQPARSLGYYRRALAIYEKTPGSGGEDVPWPLVGIGQAELALGHPERAVAPLRRALTLLQSGSPAAEPLAEAEFALARALWDGRFDRERARALALKAHVSYGQLGGDEGDDGRSAVKAWLASHLPGGAKPGAAPP